MKKKSLLFIVLLIFIKINAQNNIYQPTWESLDTRPTPAWFKNAKFGIFIHWGIYSVPMWSPKGTYEEWYKYWLDNKKLMGNGEFTGTEIYVNPEKPDVPLNKNDAFQKVQKRRVQEKR